MGWIVAFLALDLALTAVFSRWLHVPFLEAWGVRPRWYWQNPVGCVVRPVVVGLSFVTVVAVSAGLGIR